MMNETKSRCSVGKNSKLKCLLFLTAFFIANSLFLVPNCYSQWVHISSGLIGTDGVMSLGASSDKIFAGDYHEQTITGHGIFSSTDNGASWIQTSLNYDLFSSFAAIGDDIFAGTYSGVYISTDNGINWSQSTLNNLNVSCLAVRGNTVFAGVNYPNSGGVYVSTDLGATWMATSLGNLYINSLAVSGNDIYAGSSYEGVYRSTDNGSSWIHTSLNSHNILSLAAYGNYVYAGADSNGVYVLSNNGTSWTPSSLNGTAVLALAVSGNNIFAGVYGGGAFYVSTNNGNSWNQRNDGLGGEIITLCIFNNYIFAGVFIGGIYRRPIDELIGIQTVSHQIPSHFSLSQNYPNPFNPGTSIRFDIPKTGGDAYMRPVQLIIFDVLGREVATLVNQQLQPGIYEVNWDASNYPSGVYFYKLIEVDHSETRKLVFLK